MSGRVWEDRVCTGEGAGWGRMSEAVKVMGRLCQLAAGWEYPLHRSSLKSRGG